MSELYEYPIPDHLWSRCLQNPSNKRYDLINNDDNEKSIMGKVDFRRLISEELGWTDLSVIKDYYVTDFHKGDYTGKNYDKLCDCFKTNDNIMEILKWLDDEGYIFDYYTNDVDLDTIDMKVYTLLEWIKLLFKNNGKSWKTGEKGMDGLRIKRNDELSIDEFKENTKAYEELKIFLDKELVDKHNREYGKLLFPYSTDTEGEYCIRIYDGIIEFLDKALFIDPNASVPYELITKIVGTYYIKCEN